MARRFTVSARITAEDRASATIGKVESRFKRLGTSIKANALKITAALASVVVAFRAIEKAAEQIGQRGALEQTLAAQGIAINEFIGKLTELSDNQIASADLILASNRAIKLGIQATDLPGLLTTAANAAVDLGLTTTQAFNDITTGIGRASPQILDNLGITIDAVIIYKEFARSIGTTVEALTKQQKTIALTNAIMAKNADQIEKFSERQAEMTRSINRGRAAFDNLKSSAGALTGALVQATVSGLAGFVALLSLIPEAIIKIERGFLALITSIPVIGRAFDGMAEAFKNADDGIDRFQQRALKLATDLGKGAGVSARFALGMEDLGKKADIGADKIAKAGAAAQKAAGHFSTATEAAVGLGNALGVVTSAELELEIAKINEGLTESAEKLGENSREYLRLEQIATEKIESLQERIRSLRDGLGDLQTQTEDNVITFGALGEGARTAAGGIEELTRSTERNTQAAQNNAQANQGSVLAASAGRTTTFDLSGGTFSQPSFAVGGGRRMIVLPNGRLEFVT